MKTHALGTATKIAGTPGFQAPEKLREEALTTAVDVYSLGGVLTELFSGKTLYDKMDAHTIICKAAVQSIMPDYIVMYQIVSSLCNDVCILLHEDRVSSIHLLEMLLNI